MINFKIKKILFFTVFLINNFIVQVNLFCKPEEKPYTSYHKKFKRESNYFLKHKSFYKIPEQLQGYISELQNSLGIVDNIENVKSVFIKTWNSFFCYANPILDNYCIKKAFDWNGIIDFSFFISLNVLIDTLWLIRSSLNF